MDGSKNSDSLGQGKPRIIKKRDGSWAVACEEDGVTWVGKLVVVPDRIAVDKFEDELHRARKMLEGGIAAGVADDALALFDFRLGEALEVLREALKP